MTNTLTNRSDTPLQNFIPIESLYVLNLTGVL